MSVWNPLKIVCPNCSSIIRAKVMMNDKNIVRARCEICGWFSRDYKRFLAQ